jgi:hypothetical protein
MYSRRVGLISALAALSVAGMVAAPLAKAERPTEPPPEPEYRPVRSRGRKAHVGAKQIERERRRREMRTSPPAEEQNDV